MTREEFVKGHKADYATIQNIYNRMKLRERKYLESARFKVGQLVLLTMDTAKTTREKIAAIVVGVSLNQKKDLIYHFREADKNGMLSRKFGRAEIINDHIISANEISVADANIFIRETKDMPEDVRCPMILKKLTRTKFKNLNVIDRFEDKRFEEI